MELGRGSHRLNWIYRKDGSVNAVGDYFAVDNVKVVGNVLLGDINGDQVIDVADVTLLIAIVLNSTPVSLDVADVNHDGEVDVADVTALIGHVLNSTTPTAL